MVETYIDYSSLVLMPLFAWIGVIFFVLILAAVFSPRKSLQYRRVLTDMFVVGKIKQIATEEKIDLLAELKEYAKIMKARKINHESLDNTIERELQEKIAKTGDNQIPLDN